MNGSNYFEQPKESSKISEQTKETKQTKSPTRNQQNTHSTAKGIKQRGMIKKTRCNESACTQMISAINKNLFLRAVLFSVAFHLPFLCAFTINIIELLLLPLLFFPCVSPHCFCLWHSLSQQNVCTYINFIKEFPLILLSLMLLALFLYCLCKNLLIICKHKWNAIAVECWATKFANLSA